jgi:hypothetical protein
LGKLFNQPIVIPETPDPIEELPDQIVPAGDEAEINPIPETGGEFPPDPPIQSEGPGPDATEAEQEAVEHQSDVIPPPEPPGRPLSRADRQTYERAIRRFQVCGRCGYFLADCRLLLGEEALQAALLAIEDQWLQLDGPEALQPLLGKAYGIRMDQDYAYYDGLCPECRRRYVFTTGKDGQVHLKVQA